LTPVSTKRHRQTQKELFAQEQLKDNSVVRQALSTREQPNDAARHKREGTNNKSQSSVTENMTMLRAMLVLGIRDSSDATYHENNQSPHEQELQPQPSISEQRATAGFSQIRITRHCVYQGNYDESKVWGEGEHERLVE
jgi:hypothetical protein